MIFRGTVAAAIAAAAIGAAGTAPSDVGRFDAARHLVRRSLYREGFWFPLGARILDAVRLGDRLVMLTAYELRVGSIGSGRLRTIASRAFDQPHALARVGQLLAVAEGDKLSLLEGALDTVWSAHGAFQALAGEGARLWVADARRVTEFRVEDGCACAVEEIPLAGVKQLLALHGTLFARVRGLVWSIRDGAAYELPVEADSLDRLADRPAARKGDRWVLLGTEGSPRGERHGAGWLAYFRWKTPTSCRFAIHADRSNVANDYAQPLF